MRRRATSVLGSFLAVALLAIAPAFAQEEPPARVGRVSFVQGQLGFHLAGETAWSAAKANYPVATGGSFWTDPKSRAELRIGSRAIDLSGNTQLDITKLDEQVMQMALPQGRIDLRVRTLLEGESIEIDLPRGAVWILQPGTYDIDAGAPDQPERIAVFEGSARFVGGTLDVAIKASDAAVIGGAQTLTAAVEKASPDEFVKWCRSRDYDERKLAAPYRVSPQMTGYEELDEYGSWRAVPQYGEVWFPKRVASGWAPYRDGHWVWAEPWGWNWVDDEPWGFAPFHYGRWAMVEDQWGWVPGEFVPQPVYAPALVAFVGDPGTGYWDAANVGPAVGWFPLGPGEVYWPSYTRNQNYIRNINIANVSRSVIDPIASAAAGRSSADPPPQIRDQRFTNRNATTVVPARVFANADPVAPAARQMPRPVVQQAMQQAPVSVRPPQLAPASARANATPTAPGVARRGMGQPPAAGPGTPGGAHPPATPAGVPAGMAATPGGPAAGPPTKAAPGIARGPAAAAGGPGPHESAQAPPAPNAPAAAVLGIAQAPPPAATAPGPARAHGGPGVAHAPPPAAMPGPSHAPGVAQAPSAPPAAPPQGARGPARIGPSQAAREPPPPAVHGPMRVGPPPQAAHAPPAPRAAPPPPAPVPHIAPPPPQIARTAPPPAPRPPPQVVHAAPPAPAPHAAPAPPPPQVMRPPQAPHPAPAPPPQVAQAPPAAPAARPAAPPAPPPGKGGPPRKDKPPEEKH
jgi:Family of unknown function (DUF6600)